MTSLKYSSIPELPADIGGINDLTLIVFRLHGMLIQWGDRLVEPLGLTSARWQILGAIALAGQPLTAPQVGAAMGTTRQGAQKQLNLLLSLGLVESSSNPAHRRSCLYMLTPPGQRLYMQAEKLWIAKAAELAKQIPPSQVQAATTTLDAMLRYLTQPSPSEVRL